MVEVFSPEEIKQLGEEGLSYYLSQAERQGNKLEWLLSAFYHAKSYGLDLSKNTRLKEMVDSVLREFINRGQVTLAHRLVSTFKEIFPELEEVEKREIAPLLFERYIEDEDYLAAVKLAKEYGLKIDDKVIDEGLDFYLNLSPKLAKEFSQLLGLSPEKVQKRALEVAYRLLDEPSLFHHLTDLCLEFKISDSKIRALIYDKARKYVESGDFVGAVELVKSFDLGYGKGTQQYIEQIVRLIFNKYSTSKLFKYLFSTIKKLQEVLGEGLFSVIREDESLKTTLRDAAFYLLRTKEISAIELKFLFDECPDCFGGESFLEKIQTLVVDEFLREGELERAFELIKVFNLKLSPKLRESLKEKIERNIKELILRGSFDAAFEAFCQRREYIDKENLIQFLKEEIEKWRSLEETSKGETREKYSRLIDGAVFLIKKLEEVA